VCGAGEEELCVGLHPQRINSYVPADVNVRVDCELRTALRYLPGASVALFSLCHGDVLGSR